jgi:hypothetical protein
MREAPHGDFSDEVAGWCRGRSWFVRAPLLAWLAWILLQSLLDPTYQSWWKPLNLGIHELGHYLFAPFGQTLRIAGGSILQCLAPVLAAFLFWRQQRDWFAVAVCAGWLGTNFFDLATYIADARTQLLPLVSPGGGDVVHDWNYLLGAAGHLDWDSTIALALRGGAVAAMAVSLLFGGWVLLLMAFPRPLVARDSAVRGPLARPPR